MPLRAALALVLFALPAVASAQWKPTWEVRCLTVVEGLAPCEGETAGLARFYDDQLERGGRWLERLGFPAPYLTEAVGPSYLATITNLGIHSLSPIDKAAYRIVSGPPRVEATITLVLGRIFSPETLPPPTPDTTAAQRAAVLGTAVHELFHGVTAAAVGPDLYRAAFQADHDWIVEGTAEAIEAAWLERDRPTGIFTTSTDWRYLDAPLTDTLGARGTWRFWRMVGRDLGSPDEVAYLEDLFGEGAALVPGRGVPGVHDWLGRHHPEGLAHFLTEYVARLGTDPLDYERDPLLDLNGPGVATHTGVAQPLAAEAVQVGLPIPTGAPLGVEIALEPADDPALRLVVDEARLDAGRGDRNVYRTTIAPGTPVAARLVRVVNVDPDRPGATAATPFRLRVEVTDPEGCAGDVLWAATHPDARAGLEPPAAFERRYAERPELRPLAGAVRVDGLVNDGGVLCGKVARLAPPTPATAADREALQDAGRRAGERFGPMTQAEAMADPGLLARAQRMAARMRDGGLDPAEAAQEMLREDPETAELVPDGTAVHLFSPNALSWQSGTPGAPTFDDLFSAASAALAPDQPLVPYRHDGVGGWRPNAGLDVHLSIVGVAPGDLREDSTYAARATVRYRRGEGVYRTARRPGDAREADAVWHGMEGEAAWLLPDPGQPVLTGRVRVLDLTGAAVVGRFEVAGPAQLEEGSCPENPGNRREVAARCTGGTTRGEVGLAGRFVAPLRPAAPGR